MRRWEIEQVAPYYLGRDDMIMMTRDEVNAQRSEPISDHDWDKLGAIGGSNFEHPFFRIKAS